MWGYLLLSLRSGWPVPGKAIRRVLTAIGLGGLLLTYSVRLGPDAFLGLLAIMAALKPFEMHSHRDRMVTVFVAYFIVITSLFQSETLAITLYMFVSVCVTTAVLVRINDPKGRFRENLKTAAVIMAQAIPLMVVLFLLFPRIQGSLFGLSMMGKAKSGFSDFMSPGSVSMLVEDDSTAFRAEFDGPMPPPELRYWRGIVFENFDGRRWSVEKRTPETRVLPPGRQPSAYTIHLEPHRAKWLFALEMPADIPRSAILYADNTLRSRYSVHKTLRYFLTSNTRYEAATENPDHLRHLVSLPEDNNPFTVQLARKITQNAAGTDEMINRTLDYFSKGGFVYTLKPPILGRHPVDSFLFESKKGYCEHYASAFAVMMRAAGVPARIVGGYLGGEANPYGNFLVVRQTDAHAWVEVWHSEKGWLRVDPTGAVAPERITSGMEASLAAGEVPGGVMRQYLGGLTNIYDQIWFGWEAINARFNAWFEGYSYEQQRALLEKIGITAGNWAASMKALALLLLLLVLATAGVISFVVLRPPARKPDAVRKYYTRFYEKLDRAGLPRKSDIGPLDYAAFVSKKRPDLARRMDEITGLYIRLRYQDQPPRVVLADFIKKIKAFTPNAHTG
jgi:transglutaminase-like putative cysteine protease